MNTESTHRAERFQETSSRSVFLRFHLSIALMGLSMGVEFSWAQLPFQYVDVGASAGLGPFMMAPGQGGGIAAVDFDDDGDVDVFVPTDEGTPNQLYRNLGNGQFEEIAAQAGLASSEQSRCALWFDYDGDGDWDLLVANDIDKHATAFRLYRQYAAAHFIEVTQAAGLFMPSNGSEFQHRGGMSAGDLNQDGWLDVFCPQWGGPPHLFLNNQNGTFTDVSASSGIANGEAWGHQSMMIDVDHDGWLDIYMSIDFFANILWGNQQDETFVDLAAVSGLGNLMNDMGMTIGDYDNDGDFDFYTTNIYRTSPVFQHNTLFRNDSTPGLLEFAEAAVAEGVEWGGYGWGTTFTDADNDGWLDLAATNGFANNSDPSKFYWNQGGGPFTDVSNIVGFNDTDWGSALLAFDYDRDGDQDLMQACMGGPLRLLENQPVGAGHGNYLVVQPRINSGPNRFAIGAVVRIEIGAMHMMRLITAGTSYLGQEPAEAFFGLGDAAVVDSVTVNWPDGTSTKQTSVPANQVLTVVTAGPSVPALGTGGLSMFAILLIGVAARVLSKRKRARGEAPTGIQT